MSAAEDWLRAVKTEEERLLGEIMKTDLYKQLDAVRTVLVVYKDKAQSPVVVPAQSTESATPETRPASERAAAGGR